MKLKIEGKLKEEELLKKIWYDRNPQHEGNSSTGKDMFWGTVLMVIKDFNSQIKK